MVAFSLPGGSPLSGGPCALSFTGIYNIYVAKGGLSSEHPSWYRYCRPHFIVVSTGTGVTGMVRETVPVTVSGNGMVCIPSP